MRFLKSLLLLLTCCCFFLTQAQDSTFWPDTVAMTTIPDTAAVFHADKPSGALQWNEPNVPESTLQHLRSDEAFWYANADLKKKPEQKTTQHSFLEWLFKQQWFYNLLWFIIIGSCIGVLLLFLAKSNISLFRKTPMAITGNNSTEVPKNIFSIDYDEALKNAVSQNDFRFAIRLHFLQMLTLLSAKDLIQYNEGLTNSDYLQQLRQTEYYTPFKTLTRQFEYTWYGQFAVTPELYQVIAGNFATFKNNMGI